MSDLLEINVRTLKNWEKYGIPEVGLATTTNVAKLLMLPKVVHDASTVQMKEKL